jgi:hypothetical protein
MLLMLLESNTLEQRFDFQGMSTCLYSDLSDAPGGAAPHSRASFKFTKKENKTFL